MIPGKSLSLRQSPPDSAKPEGICDIPDVTAFSAWLPRVGGRLAGACMAGMPCPSLHGGMHGVPRRMPPDPGKPKIDINIQTLSPQPTPSRGEEQENQRLVPPKLSWSARALNAYKSICIGYRDWKLKCARLTT